MKEEAARVSPSVLLSIDDSDPVVCPALWEAVLYTLTTVEVWKGGTLPKCHTREDDVLSNTTGKMLRFVQHVGLALNGTDVTLPSRCHFSPLPVLPPSLVVLFCLVWLT